MDHHLDPRQSIPVTKGLFSVVERAGECVKKIQNGLEMSHAVMVS